MEITQKLNRHGDQLFNFTSMPVFPFARIGRLKKIKPLSGCVASVFLIYITSKALCSSKPELSLTYLAPVYLFY